MIKGSYFGEIELIDQVPRLFDAVCEGDCEMYVITRKQFANIEKEFGRIYKSIKEVAELRKKKNR